MATYKKIISSLFTLDQFISSSFHFDLTANYLKPSPDRPFDNTIPHLTNQPILHKKATI